MSQSAAPRLTYPGRNEPSFAPKSRLRPGIGGDDAGALPAPCCLIEGDNLLALSALREELREGVTLAYLDPPFLTGREHFHVERSRGEAGELSRTERRAFD